MQPSGWGLGDRPCSLPRSSIVCDDTDAAHDFHRRAGPETQADFSALDLSSTRTAYVGGRGTIRGDPAGTSAQGHETMALAQNASDALSGAFCKLHVGDFPVDKRGLAMWPRAELPVTRRRVRSSGKRAWTDSEASDSSGSDREEVEGELLPGVRHAKRVKRTL